ncbi:MAG: signal peptide peptidase SppA [Deltaproteobacteria bacterium]|nr:signal peptide peptidase SppA [Deltaproteobacteria bacterium]
MADPVRPSRWRRRILIALVLLVVAGFAVRAWQQRGPGVKPDSWVLLDLQGAYPEDVSNDTLARFFGEATPSLLDLLLTIRDAGEDPRVAGLVVRIRPLATGWAKAQEIRDALLHFRHSGKPLHAYLELELGGGSMEYYLASAAQVIHVPPGAAAPVTGLLASYVFLGGVWDKLDVDMQVLKVKEYKTFGDMLSEKDMTPYHREMANSLLDSMYDQLVAGIASARELEPQAVRRIIDAGPATPDELMQAGLVDDAQFLDQIRVAQLGERGEWLSGEDYAAARRPLPDAPAVHRKMAVIYGVGAVVSGESEASPTGGESSMGADTLTEAFNEAARDDDVEAIVFRIDSPGGSALASDLIWQAAANARASKPVIVSMSDVAASGGYYAAASGSRILAAPGTLTGSIGVVMAKPNLSGLLAKLGINTVELQRGDLAGMLSVNQSFTPKQLARVKATMDYIYDLFLQRVAEGRSLDKAQVNEVGRGRVWTGAQAVERGLVDEIGGFLAAINAAKTAVGIPVEEKVGLVFYPRHKSVLQRIGKALGTRMMAAAPAWWQQIERATVAWKFAPGSVLTLMPEEIRIR